MLIKSYRQLKERIKEHLRTNPNPICFKAYSQEYLAIMYQIARDLGFTVVKNGEGKEDIVNEDSGLPFYPITITLGYLIVNKKSFNQKYNAGWLLWTDAIYNDMKQMQREGRLTSKPKEERVTKAEVLMLKNLL